MADNSVWDFVEKYYPNYYSSNEIAHNDDLLKILNGEDEYNDASWRLLKNSYYGLSNHPDIEIHYYKSLIDIYEKSIEGFIKENEVL